MSEQGMVHIGGQPKKVYWTPDGRRILAMPDLHTYERRNAKGQAIESGVRDTNFDRGWLETKPAVLKLYCPNCDKWHDTEEDIQKCGERKGAFVAKAIKDAKIEEKPTERIEKLEADMAEIKGMFKQLLERL